MKMQRHLQCRFNRLRAACGEDHSSVAGAAAVGHNFGQFLQWVAGKIVSIAVRYPVELLFDRFVHLGMRVAQTIDRRPTRAVDVVLAAGVKEPDALAVGDLREIGTRHLTLA